MTEEESAWFETQALEMDKELPNMLKHAADIKRLIDLAKQSPFAAANDDFLRRMEMEWERKDSEYRLIKKLLPSIVERLKGK